jgi:hypothetical protein
MKLKKKKKKEFLFLIRNVISSSVEELVKLFPFFNPLPLLFPRLEGFNS